MRLFFSLFFLGFTCFSQNVDFEGKVLDANNKGPIPYVNISFLNTLTGTSTDEEGHFLIEISKEFLEKDVHISSLGYKDTIISAKAVYDAKELLLSEATFKLEEVVVSKGLGDAQVLNPIASYDITSGFDSSSTPWVLALYFPNIGASKKQLEKVTVFFRHKNEFSRERSKFRLRFYTVDPITKKPLKDLIQKSLILESVKGQEFTSIDLGALNIPMPREGLYIGLEWLFIPFNWYKKDEMDRLNNKPTIEDRFAPTFGGVYTQNQNYKVMIYGMGQWQEFKVKSQESNQNFIPAISMKITKTK